MVHPLSRPEVLRGLAVVAAVAVVALGAGALGRNDPAATRALGQGLAIAVVAPVEPEVEPGGTMDVGALNDGFDRAVLDRRAEAPAYDALPEPAWIGDESLGEDRPREPMPMPVNDVRYVEGPAPATAGSSDPLADGSRMFGFDRPRPDYAAERALRWNRLEAATAESREPIQYSSE